MPHPILDIWKRRYQRWAWREEAKLAREGRLGPRYRRWFRSVVGLVVVTLLLATAITPVSPVLGLAVIAAAFGFGVWVYTRTGTAWGWASYRLYDRDTHPAAFKRNVVGLAVPLVGTLLLIAWILLRSVVRAA